MKKHLEEINNEYIRYANCWEDADILLSALNISTTDRVLSVGSAGDNSFSILSQCPAIVVAVDINQTQLNLIELKKAAFKTLDYNVFTKFLGFSKCSNRWDIFQKVKEGLSPELIKFWTVRKSEIEGGIIYQGKFEKYFIIFHKIIIPLIHSKRRIDKLFDDKTSERQLQFYQSDWNNFRWRMLFRFFFSRFVLGRFGRDPQFMKEVHVSVADYILKQAQRHLSSTYCQNNYYLNFILTGTFGSSFPHYARKENFEIIKSQIDKLVLFNGLAEDTFKHYKNFNKFNLSNIFEYMNHELFEKVTKDFLDYSEPNTYFAYWNLMVNRRMSEINNNFELKQISKSFHDKDKCFFYSNFILEIKK